MSAIDEKLLRSLLDQNLSSMKTFVQLTFNEFRSEMKELREENGELRKSLEFSQNVVDEMRKEMSDLKSSVRNNSSLSNTVVELSERLRIFEDNSRNKNIRITGVPEVGIENSEQSIARVQKLLSEKLRVENVQVSDAYRIGKIQSQSTQGPRPIIVKLLSVNDKICCFKSSIRLKGSNIFISDDVCKATLEIRRQKLDFLKQKRNEGFIAYFSGIEVIVKQRREPNQNVPPSNPSTLSSQRDSVVTEIPSRASTSANGNNVQPGNRQLRTKSNKK